MKKMIFEDAVEASNFYDNLKKENKWAIDACILADGKYQIQWIEMKQYTAQDGQVYDDEMWITADGDIKLVQDLEPEHAKNIIRMIIRNNRANAALVESIRQTLADALAGDGLDDGLDGDETPSEDFTGFDGMNFPSNKTLH